MYVSISRNVVDIVVLIVLLILWNVLNWLCSVNVVSVMLSVVVIMIVEWLSEKNRLMFIGCWLFCISLCVVMLIVVM